MRLFIRVARVLALLALAVLTVSLVVGMASAATGVLEKVVLLMLIVGCVAAAAKISSLAIAAEGRLHHHR